MSSPQDRRPIRAREAGWAQRGARALQQRGFTPNQISVASIGFALLAAVFWFGGTLISSAWLSGLFLLLTAIAIQGRLICNLLDGMVAVEGGMTSPEGPIYNDLPDRISDSLILVGLGYALSQFPHAQALGWAAALGAAMTAYVRVLGGSCGLPQRFSGPMAKQHRMALLTVAALLAIALPQWRQEILLAALWIITLGTIVTTALRTLAVTQQLRERASHEPE